MESYLSQPWCWWIGARSCLNLLFQTLLTSHGRLYLFWEVDGGLDRRKEGREWEEGRRGSCGWYVKFFKKKELLNKTIFLKKKDIFSSMQMPSSPYFMVERVVYNLSSKILPPHCCSALYFLFFSDFTQSVVLTRKMHPFKSIWKNGLN